MTPAPLTAGTPDPRRPCILCVDDEPNILAALQRLFRTEGVVVRTATSGADALRVMDHETIDLVISDMRMPGMDGTQLLEHVRARWPDTMRLLLTGFADVQSIIEVINRGEICRYISKPWNDHDMVTTVRQALERRSLESDKRQLTALVQSQNEALQRLNADLETQVADRTIELVRANEALGTANDRLKAQFLTSIKVFSTLLEMRGGHLPGRARRVADLSRRIALRMQLGAKLAQDVFVAGLLHEIGKVAFADELLKLPVSAMSARQLEVYRKHPALAEQLLLPLPDLGAAAEIVRTQLERHDGAGYPDRLAGEGIPIGARILALASDFDHLQNGPPTHDLSSPSQARACIAQGRGKRYHADVVAAFLDLTGGGSSGELEQERTGEVLVEVGRLLVGMILSRDLITPSGLLMLPANHVFDQRTIDKLLAFENGGGMRLSAHVRLDGRA
jgi:response regulator RpfG family c-di-GMP phosphodiesterase